MREATLADESTTAPVATQEGNAAAPAPTGAPPTAADTATPAHGATAAPDAQPDGDGNPQEPSAQPDKTFSRDDIRRIVARETAKERRRFEREVDLRVQNEILRAQLEGRIAQPQAGDARSAQGPGERPRPENFKDWDAYSEALVDWKIEQRTKEQAARAQQGQAQDAFSQYANEVRSTLAKDAEAYEDFEEVITAPGVVFTDAMVDAVIRTAKPAAVAYYIGQHPAESRRIGALPLAMQVLEVQKIAESLTKPPAPSKAPEPIKPNAGSAAAVEPTLDSTANNYQDWLKVRRRQLGQTA